MRYSCLAALAQFWPIGMKLAGYLQTHPGTGPGLHTAIKLTLMGLTPMATILALQGSFEHGFPVRAGNPYDNALAMPPRPIIVTMSF
jgi:hypothetical protein